jgi:hypothetical protein
MGAAVKGAAKLGGVAALNEVPLPNKAILESLRVLSYSNMVFHASMHQRG